MSADRHPATYTEGGLLAPCPHGCVAMGEHRAPPAAESGTPAPEEVGREALRVLSEAATPGPWEFGTAPHPDSNETPAEYVVNALTHNGPLWTTWAHDGSTDVDYVIPALTGDGPTSEANAAFIAAAVNYLRASLLSASPASETPADEVPHSTRCNDGLPMPDDRTYTCHGECMSDDELAAYRAAGETPGPGNRIRVEYEPQVGPDTLTYRGLTGRSETPGPGEGDRWVVADGAPSGRKVTVDTGDLRVAVTHLRRLGGGRLTSGEWGACDRLDAALADPEADR